MREHTPVIYFLGTSPGRYQPIIPTFVVGWHPERLRGSTCLRGDQVNRLTALRGGVLDSADLAGGLEFGAGRIPLINPQRGIFKPRQGWNTFAREGRSVRYGRIVPC